MLACQALSQLLMFKALKLFMLSRLRTRLSARACRQGTSSVVVQLLTNVSIYWYNAAITSSMRLYYETMGPLCKAQQPLRRLCQGAAFQTLLLDPCTGQELHWLCQGAASAVPVPVALPRPSEPCQCN